MFRVVGLLACFVPSNCLYRVMSSCFKFESVMSMDLVPSCCNNECLCMGVLIEIHCHLEIEVLLRMITHFWIN
jgi:hypothetical protein